MKLFKHGCLQAGLAPQRGSGPAGPGAQRGAAGAARADVPPRVRGAAAELGQRGGRGGEGQVEGRRRGSGPAVLFAEVSISDDSRSKVLP